MRNHITLRYGKRNARGSYEHETTLDRLTFQAGQVANAYAAFISVGTQLRWSEANEYAKMSAAQAWEALCGLFPEEGEQ